MASPFKLFRKYQKTAFVLLGVMAMVSFIVLPAYLQYVGTSSANDVTFASSSFGKINSLRLASITRETSDLANFYGRLELEIQHRHQKGCPLLQRALEELQQIEEEQAVEEWLVAQYMHKEGFRVSRVEVGQYLSDMTRDWETAQSFMTEDIYKAVLKDSGYTNDYVTYLVGNRMLLEQFAAMSDMSVTSLTPSVEFDWYNRFNRNMRIEAIPVPVSDFTSKVAAPTSKQLKAFFEENRFRDRNPMTLESGFGLPMMIKGEYLYYDKSMLDTESITDEEVQQYYEANKSLFVERSTTPTPGMGTIPTPGASGTLTFPGTGETSLDLTIPVENTTTIPLAGPEGEASQETKPTATEPDVTEPAETEPVTEEPPAAPETVTPDSQATEPETAPEVTEEAETAEEAAESTSWNRRNLPIRLVSYQAEGEENAADNSGENTAPATETPVITLPVGSSGMGNLGRGLQGAGGLLGNASSLPLGGSTNPALSSTPVNYRPLDDTLKAEIREMIARERMNEKFKQVQDVINDYFSEYLKSQQLDASDVPMPDLASLAKTLGLKYVNFDKVDYFGLIGNHYDFASSVTTGSRQTPVAYGLFVERGSIIEKKAYRSEISDQKTEYVFWITEIAEPRIPDYKEAGMAEQVEARWREVQARPLAQKKAEELAEIAAKSEGMLLEYFTANPNDEIKSIVGTEFFTWMTCDYNYYEPRFFTSEVRESGVLPRESFRDNKVLKNLGDDFMKAVYNLKPGEVTVTHNEAQDTFFVVRLTETIPDESTAFGDFSASSKGIGFVYRDAAKKDRAKRLRQGAYKKVFDETSFVWKVKPSEYQQQERLKTQQRQGRDENNEL